MRLFLKNMDEFDSTVNWFVDYNFEHHDNASANG